MQKKKRITIKNKNLKKQLHDEKRKNLKKDFFELLRRAANTKNFNL